MNENFENVRRVIADAINVIETKGWCKGKLVNEASESVCTLGALDVAQRMGMLRQPDTDWGPVALDAKELVRAELVARAPANPGVRPEVRTIPGINDSPDTTQEDILLGLKHALVRAERPDPMEDV